jgi:hypothetical protein
MLRSLEIQNFKGIKEGKLEDLAQVNVLVGRNNSGKSTILDALIMLRCAVADRDYFNKNGLEQIIERRVNRGGLDPSELWFKLNSGVPLLFAAQYANGKRLTEEWSGSLGVRISSDSYEIGSFGRNSNSPREVSNTGYWQEISRAIGAAEATHLAGIHMLDPGGVHFPLAERVWAELIKDRRDVRVMQMLNEIYRIDIEYLSFMPFPQHRLVAALPHTGVAVDWLGDGMRYAVNILALGVLLRGTALLVEELETHQHPESLRKLTQTLFELAKQQDLQLFLTTHSMELITYALDTAEEKGVDLKLHHLSLDKEGTLRVTSMSQPSAQLLLDIGHDPRLHYKYIGVE